jgi:hypothetical protein
MGLVDRNLKDVGFIAQPFRIPQASGSQVQIIVCDIGPSSAPSDLTGFLDGMSEDQCGAFFTAGTPGVNHVHI